MISEELRRRISELNRAAVRASIQQRCRDPLPQLPYPDPVQPLSSPLICKLEDTQPGRVIEWPPSRFFRIERRATEIHHSAADFLDRFRFCFSRGHVPQILDDARMELLETEPLSWLFLDIECCGLSNSPVFLVGLMRFTGSDFEIHQLLARDYSEESAVLGYLADHIKDFRVLLTFNGKTFDLPFLHDRGAIHAVDLPDQALHFDLLYAARRQWGRWVPNCKLQTLERFICRRLRRGDIAGIQIPETYHEFVRTGNAVRMREVLHHNLLDLVTMGELVLHLFLEED